MDKQDDSAEVSFGHTSVLLAETIDALFTNPDGIYVDCTLGGGGHSLSLAKRLTAAGWLIAVDQDPQAIKAGRERLSEARCRVSIVQDNFKNLKQVLDELGVQEADGILFDLGVSSHQLDTAARGFSYMQDAPLDMRMTPKNDLSAYEVVNNYPKERLAQIISEYGEERWAKRIAEFIVEARGKTPVETTGQLVDIIKKAIPKAARKDGPHPAKRTFQAVRIEVNDELSILKNAFISAVDRLTPGGRLAVITFHSLEDRIAKQTIKELAKGCLCPPNIPICVCKNKPKVKIISKAITPSDGELEKNPRSRSAKLRIAEKIGSKIQGE